MKTNFSYLVAMIAVAAGLLMDSGLSLDGNAPPILPDFEEERVVELTQKVTLADIPGDAETVKMWVPIPGDRNWQRVLDISVTDAPGDWEVVAQKDGRGECVFVEWKNPDRETATVEIRCVVERQGIHFPIGFSQAPSAIQAGLFEAELDLNAPLMFVDANIQKIADEACGEETDIGNQAFLLVKKVAEYADHYSKDPSKPHCGRGSAQDCLVNGGGCCTDLHSMFIALARARGIAARMQYGYRLLDAREGGEFDPGYRCWVEYFVPGAGWVPTDIVAADNADESNPYRWSSLSPYRVWLWEGRSFELTPPAKAGAVDTMLCGWAEIDGKAVDPLPGTDGTPPAMTRQVSFRVLKHDRRKDAPKLPE